MHLLADLRADSRTLSLTEGKAPIRRFRSQGQALGVHGVVVNRSPSNAIAALVGFPPGEGAVPHQVYRRREG